MSLLSQISCRPLFYWLYCLIDGSGVTNSHSPSIQSDPITRQFLRWLLLIWLYMYIYIRTYTCKIIRTTTVQPVPWELIYIQYEYMMSRWYWWEYDLEHMYKWNMFVLYIFIDEWCFNAHYQILRSLRPKSKIGESNKPNTITFNFNY